jgi:hypothetical protein
MSNLGAYSLQAALKKIGEIFLFLRILFMCLKTRSRILVLFLDENKWMTTDCKNLDWNRAATL